MAFSVFDGGGGKPDEFFQILGFGPFGQMVKDLLVLLIKVYVVGHLFSDGAKCFGRVVGRVQHNGPHGIFQGFGVNIRFYQKPSGSTDLRILLILKLSLKEDIKTILLSGTIFLAKMPKSSPLCGWSSLGANN